MGYIVAIEGIDGAGKNTLSRALEKELADAGLAVAKLGFPAYGRTPFADFADDALHGRLATSPNPPGPWPCCSRWTGGTCATR